MSKRRSSRHGIRALCLALACMLLVGCDTQGEQQQDFVNAAFSESVGFTETDMNGQVLAEDEDDWRIAPLFIGIVDVDPAFPNPSSTDLVRVQVQVRRFNAVPFGLELRGFDPQERFIQLDALPEASDPGTYVFVFDPGLLGRRGLVRVFITAGNGDLVSYGDLFLE